MGQRCVACNTIKPIATAGVDVICGECDRQLFSHEPIHGPIVLGEMEGSRWG